MTPERPRPRPQWTVDMLGCAVRLYRRAATSRSAILLVANAIPLVGVALFGWSPLTSSSGTRPAGLPDDTASRGLAP